MLRRRVEWIFLEGEDIYMDFCQNGNKKSYNARRGTIFSETVTKAAAFCPV
jgi:hypothetical protein